MPAKKPANERAPEPFEFTFVADSFSDFLPVDGPAFGFDLEIRAAGKSKAIELPEDRFIFTSPGVKVTLTNLDTDETFTTNISGSIHEEPLPDGGFIRHYRGRNLVGDPEINDGEPGLVITAGHFIATFDAAGNLVEPLSGTGRIIDVIDLLM
jgi:hypothetical protein